MILEDDFLDLQVDAILKEVDGRGGSRPGAGRKSIPDDQKKVTVSIVLAPDLIRQTRLHPLGTSRLCEKLLEIYFRTEPF